MAYISNEQLQAFYTMDRQLYHRMVLNLQVHPNLAKEALAFWLYLEEAGCPNVVEKLSGCSNPVLNLVLQESHFCILYIHSKGDGTVEPPKNTTIPIFNGLLEFPLNLAGHEAFAWFHVQKFLANTCDRIINNNISRPGNSAGNELPRNVRRGVFLKPAEQTNALSGINGQAARKLGHDLGGYTKKSVAPPEGNCSPEQNPGFNNSLRDCSAMHADEALLNMATVPGKERAMFLTFSRGFPLRKQDLIEYFNRQFKRAVVERVLMPTRVGGGALPLYARIVMESSETVKSILRGCKKAKLVIRGKDVWARVYKRSRSDL